MVSPAAYRKKFRSRISEPCAPPGKCLRGEFTVIIEPLNISGSALIFGAGHVVRLAEFTRAVGFRTVIIDDRPEYASRERFPGADEIIVLENFEDLLKKVKVDEESYAVIVTRGHLNDQARPRAAAASPAAYIGMIGSRRKCELIFQGSAKKDILKKISSGCTPPLAFPSRPRRRRRSA